MFRTFAHFLIGLSLIFAAACSTVSSAPTGELPTSLAVPDSVAAVSSADKVVGPFDMVSVSVFGVEELSGNFQVDFEGKLKMPLVGEVQAAGFTAPALAVHIEGLLAESYLQDPAVTTRVVSSRQQLVTVDGAVERPGQYPINGQMSLLQAVSISGGPTPSSNPKRVVVFRVVDGERLAAGFNLQDIRAGKQLDPPVYGNDVIVVDGSEIKAAYQDFLNTVPLLTVFARF